MKRIPVLIGIALILGGVIFLWTASSVGGYENTKRVMYGFALAIAGILVTAIGGVIAQRR